MPLVYVVPFFIVRQNFFKISPPQQNFIEKKFFISKSLPTWWNLIYEN